MFRSKNGSTSKRIERLVSWGAAGSVLAIALGVTLLRSPAASAEREVGEAPRAIEIARRMRSGGAADELALDGGQERSLFAREPVDPSIIPHAENGAFLIRLGAILRLPEVQPHVEAINQGLARFLREMIDWPQATDGFIDLREIEWIAGAANADGVPLEEATTSTVGSEAEPGQTELAICFGGIVIRMTHAGNWQEAVLRHVPGSSLKTRNGDSYVQLPDIPELGLASMRIQFPDDKTIVLYNSSQGLVADDDNFDINAIDFHGQPAPQPYAWVSTWRAVEGGLITVVSNNGEFAWCSLPIEQREWPAFAAPLFENVAFYALGCDWTAESQRVAVQVHATCADQAAVAAINLSAATLLSRWAELFPSGPQDYGQYYERVLQFVSGAKLERSREAGNRHFVHATAEAAVNDREFFELLRQFNAASPWATNPGEVAAEPKD